jgi:hypothetical protein
MTSMRDALPAMPESFAAEDLVDRIRHGQIMTAQDLSVSDGNDINGSGQPYVKIIDLNGNLIAIVERRAGSERLDYCCVFVKPNH